MFNLFNPSAQSKFTPFSIIVNFDWQEILSDKLHLGEAEIKKFYHDKAKSDDLMWKRSPKFTFLSPALIYYDIRACFMSSLDIQENIELIQIESEGEIPFSPAYIIKSTKEGIDLKIDTPESKEKRYHPLHDTSELLVTLPYSEIAQYFYPDKDLSNSTNENKRTLEMLGWKKEREEYNDLGWPPELEHKYLSLRHFAI